MKFCIFDAKSNEFIYGTNNKEEARDKQDHYLLQNFFRLIDGSHVIPADGIHQDIGTKDINDKPIYADCSIVEFEYLDRYNKIIGYFKYDPQRLRYYLHDTVTHESIHCFDGYNEKNIKIIDTILENKLGLIKE